MLDEFVIAADKCRGDIVIPEELSPGTTLTNEITGNRIKGKKVDAGIHFQLPESGAWA